MNLLTVILKKADLTSDICKDLAEAGIHGGTIIDAVGMASIIEKMDDLPIFGMLKSILADDDDHDIVVNDEEMEKAKAVIHDAVGLEEPNTGIMFAMPVTFVEGLGA